MLAIQLKNYLKKIPDEVNILIFTTLKRETRQLLFDDLDRNSCGHIVIDAEYRPKVKETLIER